MNEYPNQVLLFEQLQSEPNLHCKALLWFTVSSSSTFNVKSVFIIFIYKILEQKHHYQEIWSPTNRPSYKVSHSCKGPRLVPSRLPGCWFRPVSTYEPRLLDAEGGNIILCWLISHVSNLIVFILYSNQFLMRNHLLKWLNIPSHFLSDSFVKCSFVCLLFSLYNFLEISIYLYKLGISVHCLFKYPFFISPVTFCYFLWLLLCIGCFASWYLTLSMILFISLYSSLCFSDCTIHDLLLWYTASTK